MITRLNDDHGRVLGFAKVTRDLTRRREMEEAIRASNRTLEGRVEERNAQLQEAGKQRRELEEQLNEATKLEAIGRLAGGVAHDFNNMLTVIQGNVELMQGRSQFRPPEDVEALAEIADAAARSADLTRQLLAFSRRQIMASRILDVNEIVTRMLPMLVRLIGEHVQILTHLAPDLLRTHADPSQVEQVLLNLVINARDAMPDGGRLTIETLNTDLDEAYAATHPQVLAGAYVLLSVSDTGTGMDEATRARVFEPFFTTKKVGKGTGLGLATVHGIVRQSNGHVHVYSEVGRGTTFKVYLPATALAPEAEVKLLPSQLASATGQTGTTATILLVEDAPAVRRLARAILASAGHTVIEASDGQSAIDVVLAAPQHIDVLVTDVVMPGMNGVQLYQKLIALRPKLRVLYMSGYTENAIVHQGVLDPDIPFLRKPFTRDAMITKLSEVLGQKARPA